MKAYSISRLGSKKLVAFTLLFLLLSITCMPVLASAKGNEKDKLPINVEWVVQNEDYVEAVVEVNGGTFYLTAEKFENGWKITSVNGVQQNSNYFTVTVIPRPPYPWWVWMGDVPAFRFYLDAPTAINVNTALATMALLTSLASAYGGIYGLIAAAIMGLLYIGYNTLYTDHHPDCSWSLWVPVDWYNALTYSLAHGLYAATCNYWWYLIAGVIPWNLGSHGYWA